MDEHDSSLSGIEETTAPPVADQAPDTDTSVAAPEESAEERRGESLSMAEALAIAKAAKESPAGDTAPEEKGPEPSDETASSDTQAQRKSTSAKLYDERGALQRILQLRKDGRLSELPPEAQGVLRRLEEDIRNRAVAEYEQRQQEEKEFRDFYLQNLALMEESPEQYAKLVTEKPELAIFMRSYQQAHPEVTLDNPDVLPRRSEQQIATEIAQAYGQGFEAMIDAVALDHGLSEEALRALKAEYRFGKHPDSMDLGTFGAKVITAVAEQMAKEMAQKEIERIKKEERKAYDLQLQRERTLRAQPPRQLPGGVGVANSGRSTGPISMREALEIAKQLTETSS